MITTLRNITKRTSFWIIFLLLLSSLFRLTFLNTMEFKADEAESFYQVYNFLHHHEFPTTGFATSIGVHNLPFFPYFLILLSILHTDPEFLAFMIALINVLMVPLFYLFIKKFYSHSIAIFSSLFVALAPWEILYSRKIWAIDVFFIFSVPFLYFLHRLIYLKDTKASFWTALFAVFLVQIEFSGLFFVLVTICYLIVSRTKINFLSAAKGVLVGSITVAPYLYYQFFSEGFCRDCIVFSTSVKSGYSFDLNHFIRPFQLFSVFNFDSILGNDYGTFFQFSFLLFFVKFLGLISVAFILVGIWHIVSKEKKHLLLVWYIILLPICYLLCGVSSYMYYYIILMPVVALIASIGIRSLLDLPKIKWLKQGCIALFLSLLMSFIVFEFFLINFLESQKVVHGDYGPIYSLGNTYVTEELKKYQSYPYYNDLKYYAFIFLYTDDFHIRLGDFFIARHDYKDAKREYSIQKDPIEDDFLTQ